VPISQLKMTPEEILLQEEPWRRRIIGGVRKEKPFGYDQLCQKKHERKKNFMKSPDDKKNGM